MPRIAATVGLLAVLAAAWLVLAPPQVGGSTRYVILEGTSMEPAFRAGDLVLVRESGAYRVGDAVAYHHPELDRTVFHRIVRRVGDRYQLRGDNNDFLDFAGPTEVPVLGKLFVRVPGAGSAVMWVRRPVTAAMIVGLLALIAGGTGALRRAGAGPRPAPPRAPAAAGEGERALTAVAVLGGVVAAALALGVLAFSRPLEREAPWDGLYRQTGTFAYAGSAPAGPVYPDGRVESPDAVFVRLVPELELRFDYALRSELPLDVAGTGRIDVVVRGDNGWTHRVEVLPETPFRGPAARLAGTLDVRRLAALARRVEGLTGTHSAAYTITVSPSVAVEGRAGSQPLEDGFTPRFSLRLDGERLGLVPTASGEDPPVTAAKDGVGVRAEPARTGFGALELETATARRLALLLAVLVLGAAPAAAFWVRRAPARPDSFEAIESRYGDLLVEARPRERGDARVVEVTSMESLVHLADRRGCVVLHERREGGHEYLVEDAGLTYRYRPPAPAPPALVLAHGSAPSRRAR